ncbi:hypothetical protein N9N67_10325 [Bacteriovoracaceae bacterium]|nr:hypothetical protein [Bacteriovoracaceae bacterium]
MLVKGISFYQAGEENVQQIIFERICPVYYYDIRREGRIQYFSLDEVVSVDKLALIANMDKEEHGFFQIYSKDLLVVEKTFPDLFNSILGENQEQISLAQESLDRRKIGSDLISSKFRFLDEWILACKMNDFSNIINQFRANLYFIPLNQKPFVVYTITILEKIILKKSNLLTIQCSFLFFLLKFSKSLDLEEMFGILFSFMFKDVGLLTIPSQPEEDLFKKHPYLSSFILKKYFPTAPGFCLTLIEQHEERANGMGFPRRLIADSIHPFSKYLIFTETFLANDDLVKSQTTFRSLFPEVFNDLNDNNQFLVSAIAREISKGN